MTAEAKVRHPIQPLVRDEHGVLRFKENAIVRALLDTGVLNMNALACMEFTQEDREQFAQLIGYSLSGFAELSYVSSETYDTATEMCARGLTEEQARIATMEETLETIRRGLRVIVPAVFRIHPDDLTT